jgi:hypothetical protein
MIKKISEKYCKGKSVQLKSPSKQPFSLIVIPIFLRSFFFRFQAFFFVTVGQNMRKLVGGGKSNALKIMRVDMKF